MYKEIGIIIFVVVLVVGLDVMTSQRLKKSVNILKDELNILRENILTENKEASQIQMEKIKEKWKEQYDILAYYIEHDELEKVATELVRLSAHINEKEFKECNSSLDISIFILEHIEEKEKFDWISLF